MYISPLTERIRKRKAFADAELDRTSVPHLFASSMASSSSVSNLTLPYSRLSMLSLPQNEHLSNIIDYQALQQTAISSENNATEYLPTTTAAAAMSDYHLPDVLYSKSPSSSSLSLSPPLPPFNPLPPQPQHKIRIIDDAKLMFMRQQINEPSLIYNQLTAEQHNSECTVNAKPKLSFSIESIIGIK